MRILAIETSCDDTGVAIIETDGKNRQKLLADFLSSQIKVHAPYGGVVPMLAKQEHQRNLLPVLKKTLKKAKLLKLCHPELRPTGRRISRVCGQQTQTSCEILHPAPRGVQNDKTFQAILVREPELLKKLEPFLKQYAKPDIDAIAVTIGPGLEPALWVGVNFARALAYFWNLPIIPVNHMEGHIAANWLSPPSVIASESHDIAGRARQSRAITSVHGIASSPEAPRNDKPSFPILCLVVSGGHTQLVLMKKSNSHGRNSRVFPLSYAILGETRDDAAGEAFDKLAKMLNLGYPGGPIVSKIAIRYSPVDSRPVTFPRPMINSGDYDFSFSGLKTAALYFIKTFSPAQLKKLAPAICAEFQQAIIDVLVKKTIRAAKEFKAKTIMLAGGVAANTLLRETLKLALVPSSGRGEIYNLKLNFSVPQKNYCADNAAMIALAAAFKTKAAKKSWRAIKAEANLRLG